MALHKDIIARENARLGTVLKGKWRLDSLIGVGGMASVYAATHRNQARVAIKMLHPEVARDSEVTARFLREGYVANKVAHPGAVTVLDDDVSEDHSPFLVMELLTGQTLDSLLSREPSGIAVSQLMPLLDQLLDVLAAAHDKGVVHRDLKPENLFLTHEGRLKVLDFGIARVRELSVHSPTATQAGSILGTPAFMAPEQALGRWLEVDDRTDIWAVGATAFTLLTGRFVHEAATIQEQLVLSATRPAPPIRHVSPSVPEVVAQVIDRALAFDRGHRFESARAMRSALQFAMGVPSYSSLPISPRVPESARVASTADEHGATLIAPLEVTSAITGRVETATGHPVTRSTVISGPPPKRRWPLITGALGLCLACGAGLVMLQRRAAGEQVVVSSASLSPPPVPDLHPALSAALPTPSAPATAQVALSKTEAPPAVALPKVPAAAKPARVVHALPPPTAQPAPRPVPTSKSLFGGDNPFDRRH
ncbi:MAG TPA: protein kinase [Polyangiaceae bacterium]|nr:protein kinase [Polyangiaceae bacterium]